MAPYLLRSRAKLPKHLQPHPRTQTTDNLSSADESPKQTQERQLQEQQPQGEQPQKQQLEQPEQADEDDDEATKLKNNTLNIHARTHSANRVPDTDPMRTANLWAHVSQTRSRQETGEWIEGRRRALAVKEAKEAAEEKEEEGYYGDSEAV